MRSFFRLLVALSLALCVSSAWATKQQIAFKGATIGADAAELQSTGIKWTCKQSSKAVTQTCVPVFVAECARKFSKRPSDAQQCREGEGGTFAGIVINSASAEISDGRIKAIVVNLPLRGHMAAVQALTERYGFADDSKTRDAIGPGPSVNHTWWRGPNGTVTVEIPGDTTSECKVVFRAATTDAERNADRDAVKKAASDT